MIIKSVKRKHGYNTLLTLVTITVLVYERALAALTLLLAGAGLETAPVLPAEARDHPTDLNIGMGSFMRMRVRHTLAPSSRSRGQCPARARGSVSACCFWGSLALMRGPPVRGWVGSETSPASHH